ncbi:MAG: hypothetical protein WBD55_08970, partial [Dehalococcoidia bacterium]
VFVTLGAVASGDSAPKDKRSESCTEEAVGAARVGSTVQPAWQRFSTCYVESTSTTASAAIPSPRPISPKQ